MGSGMRGFLSPPRHAHTRARDAAHGLGSFVLFLRVAGFVKDHTDSGHREVTEEEKKKVESRAKTAVKFRKGVSMVSGAVAKGANVAGTGVAKAGHWGVEQYKETDYYKEACIPPSLPVRWWSLEH